MQFTFRTTPIFDSIAYNTIRGPKTKLNIIFHLTKHFSLNLSTKNKKIKPVVTTYTPTIFALQKKIGTRKFISYFIVK